MKLSGRLLSLILALVLLLGALSFSVQVFADGTSADAASAASAEKGAEGVLFASSFEASDPAIQDSVSDHGFYKNLKKLILTADLAGEFTREVDLASLSGSPDFKSEESKKMLFDCSSGTKFLTANLHPSASDPAQVFFSFAEPKTVGCYLMVSANDEPGRDPVSWTLYGSTDGKTYTPIDSRTGRGFSQRLQSVAYDVASPKAYRYYRLDITENGGADMTQLADLRLGTGRGGEIGGGGDSPMASIVDGGPASSYAGNGAFSGHRALSVYAEQTAKSDTYARNLIYSGLSIPVYANTALSYVAFPSILYGYDYEDTASYMVIDLKFSDGSYLSGLAAREINGYGYTPTGIGDANLMASNQWNYIESRIGAYAAGKTITDILVYFSKETTTETRKFVTWFDDLVIENKNDPAYEHLSDYVDTRRGTNNTTAFSRGLTSPFIAMPNGFNFFAPVTVPGSNQYYNYFDNTIQQFTISHVPSTWVGDYGTWQFMVNTTIDSSNLSRVSSSQLEPSSLAASFSHDEEIARAHYYSVTFDKGSKASGVKVEMTPTVHGAYLRFTFPADAENVNIVFDCYRADGSLTLSPDGSFAAVSRHTQNGSNNLQVVGQFDETPAAVRVVGKQGIVSFPKGTKTVTMKIATSFLTKNQALHSLELELPEGATFDSTLAAAQKAWDEICGIIEVEGATHSQLITLYSCLYRAYAYPNLYSENAGTNEAPNWVYASPYDATHRQKAGKIYVNNGFWDTYRTAWGLYALLTPEKDGELLDGILAHYKDNKWIPRWVAPGGTNSMIGTSSDIIFADAYAKGVEFDYETAFASMLKNALTVSSNVTNGGRTDNNTALFTGYVPNETGNGFSWTMEDFISDYCIAVMAEYLGKRDEAEYFYNRAGLYVNMFNKSLGFFMGKNRAGSWSSGSGFNPANWWGDYDETNGWTMAFVPVYDGNGLANLYGGKEALLKKLDAYFDASVEAMKKVSVGSIHEMVEAREVRMGQYSHSNQPAHAIPYLYAYVGAPWRTQEIVREVMARLYVGSEIGQGYLGDEDNGEMSSWFILSALGLYPQTMGSGQYVIGSPLFEKATVHFDNGKTLVIRAENNSFDNIYIQSMTLNGKDWNKPYVDHADIANGGEIVFVMGDKASTWGSGASPKSLTEGDKAATPATDLADKLSVRAGAPGETLGNAVYSDIADASRLFDNTSDSETTLKNGQSITVTRTSATRLQFVTLTLGRTGSASAPTGFLLEASADGKTWVKLDEREKLTFQGAQSTAVFAVPDESFGNWLCYRLTFSGGNAIRLAEVEFLALAADGEAGTLSQKPATPALARLPGEVAPEDPTNPTNPTNPDNPGSDETTGSDGPGNTPSTGDPAPSTPNDNDDGAPIGLIIGIVVAVVVALGSSLTFALVYRRRIRK